jgi:hypothetical protein
LLYSPLLLFSFIGFYWLYKKDKWLAVGLIVFTLLNIWVLSSWDCWWYASSFGSRVMVDGYAIYGLLIGGVTLLVLQSSKKWLITGILISFGCLYLNALQSYQYYKGIISLSSMTKDHYWYVFGRWNMNDIDPTTLGLNRNDLNWPETLLQNNSLAAQKGYSIHSQADIIEVSRVSFDFEDEFVVMYAAPLNTLFTSDETLLSFNFEIHPNEHMEELYVVLRLDNNTQYFSEYLLIKPGETTFQYQMNLPIVRSMSDKLNLYIWNLGGNKGELRNFSVSSKTLMR